MLPSRFCQGQPGFDAVTNEFTLKFRDGCEDPENKPSIRRRRIDSLMQVDEVDPESPELFKRV